MNNKTRPKHMIIKGFRPESNDFPTKKITNAREKLKEAEEYFVEAKNELEEAIMNSKNQENKKPEKKKVHQEKEELETETKHKKKKVKIENSTKKSDLVDNIDFLADKSTNIKAASLEEWENFKEQTRIEKNNTKNKL